MAVKAETSLQERIQKLIVKRGGYVNKNHGDMISDPGIADLTACYRGRYLAIEVKVNDNIPTKQQGIHARRVLRAGGISIVAWSIEVIDQVLSEIDRQDKELYAPTVMDQIRLKDYIRMNNIDNGARY